MRVYLARHGETTWNVDGRYQGQLNESELTSRGKLQAAGLADALGPAGVGAIISSPLRRCVQTASAVAETCNVKIQIQPLLREISHGTWEGLLKGDVQRTDPQTLALWRERPYGVTFDGGETLEAVTQRWNNFADDFRPPAPTLIVTHDVLVRLALIESGSYDPSEFWTIPCTNCGYAIFDVTDRWRLVDPFVDRHLAGLSTDTSAQAL